MAISGTDLLIVQKPGALTKYKVTVAELSSSGGGLWETSGNNIAPSSSTAGIVVQKNSVINGLNIGVGGAGAATSTQLGNTVLGFEALPGVGAFTQTGQSNTVIGYQALKSSEGSQCVAVGYKALSNNGNTVNCIAIGYQAMMNFSARQNPISHANIAIGDNAMVNCTEATSSIAIGQNALFDMNPVDGLGGNNVAVGVVSCNRLTEGEYNVALGMGTGHNILTGSQNTFVGNYAGSHLTNYPDIGDNNTGIGANCLQDLQDTAENNTAIGFNSGAGLTGSNNVILGSWEAVGPDTSIANTIILANGVGEERARCDNTGTWTFSGSGGGGGGAPLDSPNFTGTPTAPTAAAGTNTTQLATTAFVMGSFVSPNLTGTPTTSDATAGASSSQIANTKFVTNGISTAVSSIDTDISNINTALASKANIASPSFTGVPAAPTANAGAESSQIATTQFVATAVSIKANLASPTFTGIPTAPTGSVGLSTTQIATTAFVSAAVSAVDTALADKADIASPDFTGVPTAPTAALNTNTLQLATTAFVQNQLSTKANLNSPEFIGVPLAPTANPGTDTTQIASTAFVSTAVTGLAPLASPNFTGVPVGPTPAIGINTSQLVPAAWVNTELGNYAPLASPSLSGTPTTPTANSGTDTTQIASTAFVSDAVNGLAPLASPSFTGVPAAPTANAGADTTQLATTAFVTGGISTAVTGINVSLNAKADIASPDFTGVPTAPTAVAGADTTQLATTAFVSAAVSVVDTALGDKADIASPAFTGTPTAPTGTAGLSTTQIATTAFVTDGISTAVSSIDTDISNINTALGDKADIASPSFTGVPAAPTGTAGLSTTQIATTAFVTGGISTAVSSLDTDISNINTALADKADIASPDFTGTPTAPTGSAGLSTTQLATTAFVTGGISTAVSDINTALGDKADIASPTFTGTVGADKIDASGDVLIGSNPGNAANNTDGGWYGASGRVTLYHSTTQDDAFLTCSKNDGAGSSTQPLVIGDDGDITAAGDVILGSGSFDGGAARIDATGGGFYGQSFTGKNSSSYADDEIKLFIGQGKDVNGAAGPETFNVFADGSAYFGELGVRGLGGTDTAFYVWDADNSNNTSLSISANGNIRAGEYIGRQGKGGFYFGDNSVLPANNGALTNGTTDLGSTNYAWANITAAGKANIGSTTLAGVALAVTNSDTWNTLSLKNLNASGKLLSGFDVNNNEKVTILATGKIVSGGDAEGGANNGSTMFVGSGFMASYESATAPIFRGYTTYNAGAGTGSETPTFNVSAGGAVTANSLSIGQRSDFGTTLTVDDSTVGISVGSSNGLVVYTSGKATSAGDITANLFISSAYSGGSDGRPAYFAADGTLTDSSSDRRLKKNIETIGSQVDNIKALNPVSFNWIDTDTRGAQNEIGFIAQEMQEIIPEVVGFNRDQTLTLDYAKLVPVLTSALQEALSKIETLEAKVAVLESE